MIIHKVLASLMKGRQFSCKGNWKGYEIECDDGLPIPTLEELQAENDRLEAVREATKYKKKRAKKYPSHEEMMEALWEMLVEGRPEKAKKLDLKRQKIKTMFPKKDK